MEVAVAGTGVDNPPVGTRQQTTSETMLYVAMVNLMLRRLAQNFSNTFLGVGKGDQGYRAFARLESGRSYSF
jgi:hypothetical protein